MWPVLVLQTAAPNVGLRAGLSQDFSASLELCVHSREVEGRALHSVCCINKYLGSGQILCIIPAMVFVIREMPFGGWVLFFPSSSLSQAWRKQ